MVVHIVKILASRKTFWVVLVFWLLSFVGAFTYVWEEHLNLPGGGSEVHYNFLEFRRTSLFVWLTFIMVGYTAHALRRRSLGHFAIAESVVGLVAGYFAVTQLSLRDLSSWVAIATSAFLVVRGVTNISQAAEEAQATVRQREAQGDLEEDLSGSNSGIRQHGLEAPEG